MTKYTLSVLIFSVTFISLSFGVNIVVAESAVGIIPSIQATNADELVVESAPVVVVTNGNETGAIIPSSQGTGANETGTIIPNSQGSNGDDSGTTNSPIVSPVTPSVTPPGSSGSGNVFSGSSSGSSRILVSRPVTPIVTLVSTTSCPLITDYLKLGGVNNPVQVSKLQIFLKNSEKLNVDVSGVFDQKTEDAVKVFQLKYLPSILEPWDATRATGFVYITTTKKINELACASPLTLSAEEQAIIAAYIAGSSGDEASIVIGSSNTNATGTLEVGNLNEDDNVAGVGGASILSRFWDFIVNLFK